MVPHHEIVSEVSAAIERVYRRNLTFNNLARAAIAAMRRHYAPARRLRLALDRERAASGKLRAKLAAAFPTDRRYDRFGEIRTLARAPEGFRIVRRTGRPVASFVMGDEEWNELSAEPVDGVI